MFERLRSFFRRRPVVETEPAAPPEPGRQRGRVDHVIILDGTMSSLDPGMESNAGLTYRLLAQGGPSVHRTLYYEPGQQWQGWRRGWDIVQGRGINKMICRAYGYLASHYREGDRIFLFGYSRGAFAVRSLAGVIDRVGLLRREEATERNVRQAYRHYRDDPGGEAALVFARTYCHQEAPVEVVGVWDTVKAIGLRLPVIWKLTQRASAFHNTQLGLNVRHGFHALALDETRNVFAPVLWSCPPRWEGHVEQVWFRGAHGDIGGQLGDFDAARPLANIPLSWMLSRAEACGLTLPPGWQVLFPCDPKAPMVGTWSSWGKFFLGRRRRRVGLDRSERLHETVPQGQGTRWPQGLPAE